VWEGAKLWLDWPGRGLGAPKVDLEKDVGGGIFKGFGEINKVGGSGE